MRLAALLALAALAAGCRSSAPEPEEIRLPSLRLDAPARAAAGAPVALGVRYGVSPCYALTALAGRAAGPGVVEFEARARYAAPPGAGCPDVLELRDTTYVVTAPAAGELLVIGLQPDGARLERRVAVSGH
jgi:hypothetical protein